MAQVKSTTRQWVDVSADDFGAEVQAMLQEERAIYDMLKAHKAKITAAVKSAVPAPAGRQIIGLAYTRWGQLQLVVDDAPKASAPKLSLADFIASQSQAGLRA